MCDIQQKVLNRRVFRQELYDLHVSEFMVGQTGPFINPNKNVVDVGAAVGLYSTFWADKCRHLYAFEAVPVVFEQTKKFAEKFDNVTAINKAVSDFEGTAEFFVDDKRLSNSSFQNLVDGPAIEVPVTTLDASGIDNVGFLKIDVEGVELRVLKGGEQMIDRDRPVCMIEIYPKFNEGPVSETFKFLFNKGYACHYNARGKSLEPLRDLEHAVAVASDEEMWTVHDCDFLFTPQ